MEDKKEFSPMAMVRNDLYEDSLNFNSTNMSPSMQLGLSIPKGSSPMMQGSQFIARILPHVKGLILVRFTMRYSLEICKSRLSKPSKRGKLGSVKVTLASVRVVK